MTQKITYLLLLGFLLLAVSCGRLNTSLKVVPYIYAGELPSRIRGDFQEIELSPNEHLFITAGYVINDGRLREHLKVEIRKIDATHIDATIALPAISSTKHGPLNAIDLEDNEFYSNHPSMLYGKYIDSNGNISIRELLKGDTISVTIESKTLHFVKR